MQTNSILSSILFDIYKKISEMLQLNFIIKFIYHKVYFLIIKCVKTERMKYENY